MRFLLFALNLNLNLNLIAFNFFIFYLNKIWVEFVMNVIIKIEIIIKYGTMNLLPHSSWLVS